MDTKPPSFDKLLEFLALIITAYTILVYNILIGAVVGFFAYNAYTWIVAFRHSRKRFAKISESNLSSKYPKSFKTAQDAFVAARDALNFRDSQITDAETINARNNCIIVLRNLQIAISDEKYKPEKQLYDSLKLFIIEFTELFPDWVYERNYMLDQIRYNVCSFFTTYDNKQIEKKEPRQKQKQGQRRKKKKRKRG
ncbi:MAG: hypothetical protein M0R31_05720 [Candidatus Riflebacteria bacterium]|nr:hypothetical protein [Candidatus Riflebacteria bacterium]